MPEFVHTIKQEGSVKQPDNIEIEWSLKINEYGSVVLCGNRRDVLFIDYDGNSFAVNLNARELGLRHGNLGGLKIN